MFKLQIHLPAFCWRNVNKYMLSMVPEDCDALAWVRKNWPASDFRIVYKKEKA
jgi:hypothetical protein